MVQDQFGITDFRYLEKYGILDASLLTAIVSLHMRLPVDEELRSWAEKNTARDVDNGDFLSEFLKDGDLDKKDRVLFAMIILLAGRIEQDFRRLKTLLAVTIIICLVNVIIIL